ncbi:hypothetical protein AAFG07_34810 [Bradyrhizobium sp. B097]|uniref:hypothetical protein n=1 Tax=Bradyrhizobium sp. B097 TaxID=3140244 RepID=UPI0031841808
MTDFEGGSSSTVMNGNMRAGAIPERERCRAAAFVKARAELAASLAGANVGALSYEIRLAEQRTTRWSTTSGSSAGSVDAKGVLNEVLASSYLELHRFQNQSRHSKPRVDNEVGAIEHVRSMANLRCHTSPHVSRAFSNDDIDEIDMGRMAAMHTYGYAKLSSFVSLAQDPSRLLVSDDSAGAAIAEKAKELHTYTVPRVAAWPADRIDGVLGV